MKKASLALLLSLILAITALSASFPDRAAVQGPIFLTGLEDTSIPADYQAPRPSRLGLDEYTPGSVLHTAGTTWYDNQHNGTQGKQIAVDYLGYVHNVWTNGENESSGSRHVYYNCWDPVSESFIQGAAGLQVDASTRAGYVTVAVNSEGYAFPAFHQVLITGGGAYAAAAIDLLPATGAFASIQIPLLPDEPEVIWPVVDIDINDDLHVLCTESEGNNLEYYAKGTPTYSGGFGESIDWGSGFRPWSPTAFITLDVSTSYHSDRVAVAWLRDPPGEHDYNNVWLQISEDRGATWGDSINVTAHAPIDTQCVALGGDPNFCNGDTLRPWIDCAVLVDQNDNVHVFWSASAWYWFDTDGTVGPFGLVYSTIWHWDLESEIYTIVHDAFYAHSSVALGINNLMVHRPNPAIDTTNGNLYCSFVKFDSVQVSQSGFPSGDAWVSVSTDGGRTWSAGTNVTGTVGSGGGVDTPSGECMSERDVTLAKFVTNGTIHMQYTLDHDNGTAILEGAEGAPTLNPIIYQEIPVVDIPTRPLINPFRAYHADSTGYPFGLDTTDLAADDFPTLVPGEFALHQNYPNPFNPTTNIQFDLGSEVPVTLKIYDVTGREVKTLMHQRRLSAGTHVVEFDAAALPSGVYLYSLATPGDRQTRKMMLIK